MLDGWNDAKATKDTCLFVCTHIHSQITWKDAFY